MIIESDTIDGFAKIIEEAEAGNVAADIGNG